jgi:hypothetical protein
MTAKPMTALRMTLRDDHCVDDTLRVMTAKPMTSEAG